MDIKRVNPISEVYSVHNNNNNKNKKNGREQKNNNSSKSFKEILDEANKRKNDDQER